MEGSSRAAKKACVRRVPRARARARPVHVLLFIVFEGWQLRVGERREIERGVARMHEELEQQEREQWYGGQAGDLASGSLGSIRVLLLEYLLQHIIKRTRSQNRR